MSKLSILLGAAVALAVATSAAPSLAGPAHAYVYGAIPLDNSPPGFAYDNDAATDYGFHGNPLDRYYDPTGVIPDTRYYGKPPVDMVLARTLDNNHETILSHMLKCQAHYPTYTPAGNYYLGAGGQPVACYL